MAPTPLPRRISLAVLKEIILQIREVDMEAHMEYRWYEPWDIILNDILQVSSARNELTVAPQFKVAREAFKFAVDEVVDVENSQDLVNASMDVNISMIDLGNDEEPEDEEYEELTREERIPDFLLFHVSISGRQVVLLVEIKPEKEGVGVDQASLLMAMNNAYDQVVTQVKFVFEKFQNQTTVHTLLVVGTTFCFSTFERGKLPALPQYLLKYMANSDSMPYAAKVRTTTSRVLEIHSVFLDDAKGFRLSDKFKECIDTVMYSQGLPKPQWEHLE